MKKMFIPATIMVAIIVIRMILSVTISEQAAEVFCRVSISFLFLYFVCRLSANKPKTTK